MFKLSFVLAILAVASAKPSVPYSAVNTGYTVGPTYLPPVASAYSAYSAYSAPSVYSAGQTVYPASQNVYSPGQAVYPAGQSVFAPHQSVYPAAKSVQYSTGHSGYPASYPTPAVSYVKNLPLPVTTGQYASPAVSYVKNVAAPAVSTAHFTAPVNTGYYTSPVVASPTVVKPYSTYSVQPAVSTGYYSAPVVAGPTVVKPYSAFSVQPYQYYPGYAGYQYSGFSGLPTPVAYGSPLWKKK